VPCCEEVRPTINERDIEDAMSTLRRLLRHE
jgi:hypothetical protein